MRARTAIATTLVAALAGCASCDDVPDAAVTDCNAQVVPGAAATDLLVVVDDSASMDDEQAELAASLAGFIEQLLSSAIALDLQVGVTNTSVSWATTSPDAEGETAYAYGPMVGKPYPRGSLVAVLDPDGLVTPGLLAWDPALYGTTAGGWGGRRILSGANRAELERVFKANVRQGARGSGKEQPLRAMRLAIDKAHAAGGENLGFLRDGARLAVVIVTNEDDCSQSAPPFLVGSTVSDACHQQAVKDAQLDPLADYVALLDSTVGGEPIVAIVAEYDAATLEPTGCTTSTLLPRDAPTRLERFRTLLDAAHPGRTFKDSLCKDFGPTLLRVAELIIPQTMPLRQAPADPRMLAVAVAKASGATVPCRMELASSPDAALADVVYAGGTSPPTLTFQRACRLGLGDRVDLRIVCAR